MKNISIIIIFASIVFSCGEKEKSKSLSEDSTKEIFQIDIENEKFTKMGLETGEASLTKMSDAITVNGMVDVPPENIAKVSFQLPGVVKSLSHNVLPGKYVAKGAILARIQSMELIQLQQDYLEKYAQRTFFIQELERQKSLSVSDASAKRKLQEAENNFKVNNATLRALEEKLKFVGLNPEKVQNGELVSFMPIVAPFSGFIQKVNINTGSNFSPSDVLFEMINKEHLHIELKVFEKDIYKIKEGQIVIFNDPKLGGEASGKVFLIGKNFETDARLVNVHVHLNNESQEENLIPGQYIKAEILTESRDVQAIPESALYQSDKEYFIFKVLEKSKGMYKVEKVKVEIGQRRQGKVEILSPQNLNEIITTQVHLVNTLYETEE